MGPFKRLNDGIPSFTGVWCFILFMLKVIVLQHYIMIKFFLLVTNHGQPRIRKYYGYPDEEMQFETELIKKCLTRNEHSVRQWLCDPVLTRLCDLRVSHRSVCHRL